MQVEGVDLEEETFRKLPAAVKTRFTAGPIVMMWEILTRVNFLFGRRLVTKQTQKM